MRQQLSCALGPFIQASHVMNSRPEQVWQLGAFFFLASAFVHALQSTRYAVSKNLPTTPFITLGSLHRERKVVGAEMDSGELQYYIMTICVNNKAYPN
jgi:hypothetical protein